ncbi:hypothetical protein L2E82_01084 [Cichorium intybus]|uniref:Uncharacterized protein n=1 Tax=Cichorium intybus TaxID=13427 RepID=A0ACB9GYP9_CICIN|nr:hypothetical protein L2E82_01084 [Cichorium intybus]
MVQGSGVINSTNKSTDKYNIALWFSHLRAKLALMQDLLICLTCMLAGSQGWRNKQRQKGVPVAVDLRWLRDVPLDKAKLDMGLATLSSLQKRHIISMVMEWELVNDGGIMKLAGSGESKCDICLGLYHWDLKVLMLALSLCFLLKMRLHNHLGVYLKECYRFITTVALDIGARKVLKSGFDGTFRKKKSLLMTNVTNGKDMMLEIANFRSQVGHIRAKQLNAHSVSLPSSSLMFCLN